MSKRVPIALSLAFTGCFADAPTIEDEDHSDSTDVATSSTTGAGTTATASSNGPTSSSTTSDDTMADASSGTSATSTGPELLGALFFDGDGEATSQPTPLATLPEVFTIEVWFEVADEPPYGVIIDARTALEEGWVLDIGKPGSAYPGRINLGWGTGGLLGPDVVGLDAAWHHLAFTRDVDGLATCWIDGEMVVTAEGTAAPVAQVAEISIGRYRFGEPATDYWLRGAALDDVHVSGVARYTDSFVPGPAVVDEDSVLLWTFDEGGGDVAVDQVAGVELDVVGAEWVGGT